MEYLTFILITGIGATAVMDLWVIARRVLFGIPAPDYSLVGRWLGHMCHLRFRHDSIAAAPRVYAERLIGWTAHYFVGIAFAALLLSARGPHWILHPTLVPALIVGIGTVAFPFLLMQPAMGSGVAASRTAHPNAARLQSLITHTVFGLGLYAAGCLASFFISP